MFPCMSVCCLFHDACSLYQSFAKTNYQSFAKTNKKQERSEDRTQSHFQEIMHVCNNLALFPPLSQALDLVLLFPLNKRLQLVFLHVGSFSLPIRCSRMFNFEVGSPIRRRNQKHTSRSSILKTKVASNKYGVVGKSIQTKKLEHRRGLNS